MLQATHADVTKKTIDARKEKKKLLKKILKCDISIGKQQATKNTNGNRRLKDTKPKAFKNMINATNVTLLMQATNAGKHVKVGKKWRPSSNTHGSISYHHATKNEDTKKNKKNPPFVIRKPVLTRPYHAHTQKKTPRATVPLTHFKTTQSKTKKRSKFQTKYLPKTVT